MKTSSPIATKARVPPIAAPATRPGEGGAVEDEALFSEEDAGMEPLGFAVAVDDVDSGCEVDNVEEVLAVLLGAAEGRDDEAAARFRSAYWILHRTIAWVALKPGWQLVKRGQQASVVPGARSVQGTGFRSLQTDSRST